MFIMVFISSLFKTYICMIKTLRILVILLLNKSKSSTLRKSIHLKTTKSCPIDFITNGKNMKEYVIRPKTRDINMFVINNSGEELLGTGRQNTGHLLSRIKLCHYMK